MFFRLSKTYLLTGLGIEKRSLASLPGPHVLRLALQAQGHG